MKNVNNSIEISSAGKLVQKYVLQPLAKRKPVGYQRDFLERYCPNQTYYLSSETRDELKKLGTTMQVFSSRSKIDLCWNSSRLEANAYGLAEAESLLLTGEDVAGKLVMDRQMLLNHQAAIDYLLSIKDELSIKSTILYKLHKLLSTNLLSSSSAEGHIRQIQVIVGGTVYYPLNVTDPIEAYFLRLVSTAAAIEDPFEQAFFLFVHVPYLQGFADVNKRLSRVAANIPLLKHNYYPLTYVNLPQNLYLEAILGVYELNDVALLRDVFVWCYKQSVSCY